MDSKINFSFGSNFYISFFKFYFERREKRKFLLSQFYNRSFVGLSTGEESGTEWDTSS